MVCLGAGKGVMSSPHVPLLQGKNCASNTGAASVWRSSCRLTWVHEFIMTAGLLWGCRLLSGSVMWKDFPRRWPPGPFGRNGGSAVASSLHQTLVTQSKTQSPRRSWISVSRWSKCPSAFWIPSEGILTGDVEPLPATKIHFITLKWIKIQTAGAKGLISSLL